MPKKKFDLKVFGGVAEINYYLNYKIDSDE